MAKLFTVANMLIRGILAEASCNGMASMYLKSVCSSSCSCMAVSLFMWCACVIVQSIFIVSLQKLIYFAGTDCFSPR